MKNVTTLDIANVKKAWDMASGCFSLFRNSMSVLEEACRNMCDSDINANISSDENIYVETGDFSCRNANEFFHFCMNKDKDELSEEDFKNKWNPLVNSF